MLEKWLPKETLRINDDLDIVTYLPPIGVSVGDKLWLVNDKSYMISKESMNEENSWAESVWLNLRLIKSLVNQSKTHRVMSHAKKLEQLNSDMSKKDD